MNREAIVAEARAVAERHAKVLDVPLRASCLLHAHAVIRAAAGRGLRLVLQAGTLAWPYVAEDLDDGKAATHFSYEFHLDQARARATAGLFPEMHVWAGDPERVEVVDLTTLWLPEQAKATLGLPDGSWTAPTPPTYLWGKPPHRVAYRPDEAATWMAVGFLRLMLHDLDLFGAR